MCLISGKDMSFKSRAETFRLDGRITQRIRQWVSYRRAGDCESPGAWAWQGRVRGWGGPLKFGAEVGNCIRRLWKSTYHVTWWNLVFDLDRLPVEKNGTRAPARCQMCCDDTVEFSVCDGIRVITQLTRTLPEVTQAYAHYKTVG